MGSNWFDIGKAAIWPATALIFLFVLQGPVSDLLTANEAQEIEAGPVKIRFASGAQELPVPSPKVAEALPFVEGPVRDRLLLTQPSSTYYFCKVLPEDIGPGDTESYKNWLRLSELELAKLDASSQNQGDCPAGNYYEARLNEVGVSTRSYLLELLSESLTFSKSDSAD